MTTILDGPDAVRAAVGTHLGYTDWLELTQERVDHFADATSGTGALEHLVLALSNFFLPQLVDVRGFSMGVNYGTGSVRFPSPVTVGNRLRGGAELTAVSDIAGGLQTEMLVTVELEDRPAAVIEALSRWLL